MKNRIGILFYALTILAALTLVFFVTTATGIGPAAAAGNAIIVLFGLAIVACLALVSLVVGWQVKLIRYSLLGLGGLIALSFPLSMVFEAIGDRISVKNQEVRTQYRQAILGIVDEYKPQLFASRADPAQVLSLIDMMEEEVQSICRDNAKCRPSYEYINLKESALLYLGIFTDPKYMEMVSDDLGSADFYVNFYEENKAAFTKQEHFSSLFKLMYLRTYDKNENAAWGLHRSDQIMFSRILAQNEYLEAYLLFIPLTTSDFFVDSEAPTEVLKGALSLENALGTKDATTASISHTAYHYFADGYKCELEKFDNTFHVLRDSRNFDEHIAHLFAQMPEQCANRAWDAAYNIDEHVYCYLQKSPNWVSIYTSDEKLRAYLFENVDCAAFKK